MGENGTNGHLPNPDVGGRGSLPALNGLDCANNPRDLATVNEALRRWPKRWRGQTPEMKEAVVADVDAGRKRARAIMDETLDPVLALTAIDRINTAARVHTTIEGQEQADLHAETQKAGVQINIGTFTKYVAMPESEL